MGALELIESTSVFVALAMIERHGQAVIVRRKAAATVGTYNPATGSLDPPEDPADPTDFATRGVWRNSMNDAREEGATVQEEAEHLLVAVRSPFGELMPFVPEAGDFVIVGSDTLRIVAARPFRRMGTPVAYRLDMAE